VEEKVAEQFYNTTKALKGVLKTINNILCNTNGRAIMDKEDTGLYSMFKYKKEKELNRIYTLLFNSDHKNYFCNIFAGYIEREGTAIIDRIFSIN
jgi:hypothetical protein